jgi:hypothetical protein
VPKSFTESTVVASSAIVSVSLVDTGASLTAVTFIVSV